MNPQVSLVRAGVARFTPVGRNAHRGFFGDHESLAATCVSSAIKPASALLNTCRTAMRAHVSGSGSSVFEAMQQVSFFCLAGSLRTATNFSQCRVTRGFNA